MLTGEMGWKASNQYEQEPTETTAAPNLSSFNDNDNNNDDTVVDVTWSAPEKLLAKIIACSLACITYMVFAKPILVFAKPVLRYYIVFCSSALPWQAEVI